MKKQAGFTLIELIAVIVILGILAATALPRFVDMSDAAEQAALEGIAGNMGSAMALNYASAIAANAGVAAGTITAHVAVDNCNDAPGLLVGGVPGAAGEYTVGSVALATLGAVGACTLTHTPSSRTATFQGIGAP